MFKNISFQDSNDSFQVYQLVSLPVIEYLIQGGPKFHMPGHRGREINKPGLTCWEDNQVGAAQ